MARRYEFYVRVARTIYRYCGGQGGGGGLQASPMIQCVTVRARFLKCKQNLFLVHGHLPFFIWFVLRFGSLLLPQAWVYFLFMLLGIFKVRFYRLLMFILIFYLCRESCQFLPFDKMAVIPQNTI